MAALGSTMAVVVRALEMGRERIPATRTVSSLQQLCSRYCSDSSCLASVSRAAEQAFACLLICIDNLYRHFPAQVTLLC